MAENKNERRIIMSDQGSPSIDVDREQTILEGFANKFGDMIPDFTNLAVRLEAILLRLRGESPQPTESEKAQPREGTLGLIEDFTSTYAKLVDRIRSAIIELEKTV